MKRSGCLVLFVFFIAGIIKAQNFSEKVEIGPGVYFYEATTNQPNVIKIIEIDLTKKNKAEVGIANDKIGHGGERLSSYIKRTQGNRGLILGGVNGDFFGGNPHAAENSMIIQGEMAKGINGYDRPLFAITKDNKPHIESFDFRGYVLKGSDTLQVKALNKKEDKGPLIFTRFFGDTLKGYENRTAYKLIPLFSVQANRENRFVVKGLSKGGLHPIKGMEYLLVVEQGNNPGYKPGDTLKVYLGTTPKIEGIYSFIGGLPELVRDGKRPETFEGMQGVPQGRFLGPNPRTAIGFSEDSTRLYLVAVDGRQPDYSVGMSLIELSDFLIKLGCAYAMNFDGGGSTVMTVRDSVVNKPSDYTGERPVHNYLFISADNGGGLFNSFGITNEPMYIRDTTNARLKIEAEDKWGYRYDYLGSLPQFNVGGPSGYINPDDYSIILFEAGKGDVTGKLGSHEGRARFKSYIGMED